MADLGRTYATWFEIFDQRNIGRRTADIKRQDVLDACVLPDPKRAGHAACWTRHQNVDGMLLRFLRGHQSTIGPQQRQFAGETSISKLAPQIGDIFADHRTDRGVSNGCQCPLIFLHFRQNFMAERHGNIRHHFTREIADLLFMRAIGVGVHKADGDRLNALFF